MDNVTATVLTQAINRLCDTLEQIRKDGVQFVESPNTEIE